MSADLSDVEWSIVAVDLQDESWLQLWFAAVCDAYQEQDETDPVQDWSSFVVRLSEKAKTAQFDDEFVAQFVKDLADRLSSPLDVIAEIFARRDGLPEQYGQTRAKVQASEAADHDDEGVWDEHTPAEWYAFLISAAVGEEFSGWSGVEADWEAFKKYFLYCAGLAEVQSSAEKFLEDIERHPDKVDGFAEHGIVIERVPAGSGQDADHGNTDPSGHRSETREAAGTPASDPEVSAYPELAKGAEGPWVDYLDAVLKSKGF